MYIPGVGGENVIWAGYGRPAIFPALAGLIDSLCLKGDKGVARPPKLDSMRTGVLLERVSSSELGMVSSLVMKVSPSSSSIPPDSPLMGIKWNNRGY